jgi:prepilin-type N-terminal cleavage/methylation domain-containing protein
MRLPKAGQRAFTLVEIMIVIAIIGLLAAIAIPNFMKHRAYTQTQACIANLSKLDASKEIWGLEHGKTTGGIAAVDDIVGSELYLRTMPVCPAGGNYSLMPIGTKPTCDMPDHVLQ